MTYFIVIALGFIYILIGCAFALLIRLWSKFGLPGHRYVDFWISDETDIAVLIVLWPLVLLTALFAGACCICFLPFWLFLRGLIAVANAVEKTADKIHFKKISAVKQNIIDGENEHGIHHYPVRTAFNCDCGENTIPELLTMETVGLKTMYRVRCPRCLQHTAWKDSEDDAVGDWDMHRRFKIAEMESES